jgi:hypothetical protein
VVALVAGGKKAGATGNGFGGGVVSDRSRHAAELNPEGTDYLLRPDASPEATLAPALETLRQLLSQCPGPLTRQEIIARWPGSDPPPRPDSLWRTLTRGCALGILIRTGAGTKAEAFRDGLAEEQPAA